MRGLVVLAAVVLTAACGAPPDLTARRDPVPEASTSPAGSTPPVRLTPRPTPSATPVAWPETTAVDCAGRPGKDQVVTALRRSTNIEPGDVITGPLCSGTWQFTVFAVPGRDAVEVLTKTTPTGLELVAAG